MPKNPSKVAFFSVIEWRMLKKAFIILSINILLGVICLVSGYVYFQRQLTQVNASRMKIGELNTQLMRKKDALQIVDGHYIESYENFIKKGFFLNEYNSMEMAIQQEQMVEKIWSLIPQLNFPSTEINSYQFDDQKLYQISHVEMESEYKVYVVPLTLRLGVLHEGDALRLLKSIDFQNISGILNVQRCDVERLREVDVKNAVKPYFTMTCVLLWYTSQWVRDR
jgi:tRNA U34 5-carboxymethylaminomethyl modifying enzyme MnmG/GidA